MMLCWLPAAATSVYLKGASPLDLYYAPMKLKYLQETYLKRNSPNQFRREQDNLTFCPWFGSSSKNTDSYILLIALHPKDI